MHNAITNQFTEDPCGYESPQAEAQPTPSYPDSLTLGEKRQAMVTLADKLMVTDMLVMRSGTWLAVPK